MFNPRVPGGINPPFGGLSPTQGYVVHVLLTRAPLESTNINTGVISFDLHVLNTPPAFVLSQNQTLRKNSEKNDPASLLKRLLFIFQIDFGELIRGCPHPYSPRPRASSDNLAVIVESTRSAQFNYSSLPNTRRYIAGSC